MNYHAKFHVPRIAIALIVALVLGLPIAAGAHDIPSDVTVHLFAKPEGQRLQLIVRVPLGAMRDVYFSTRGPGYLNLERIDAALHDAATVWILNQLELYEDGVRARDPRILHAIVSLPSDRSFISYQDALAHITGPPLPPDTELYWNQALLDVLVEYPIHSDKSRFSLHPGFALLGLRVVTVIRFLPPGGAVRAMEFVGDPGLVALDPRWYQAALRFVELGLEHILSGIDHLLFLLCLVIPLRRIRPIILVVTAFTVAHSITLIASAYNLAPNALWFPALIETLIATSIFYMALENIVVGSRETVVLRRWTITFGFGLIHGFGFSFALRHTLQLAGSHLLTSLLSFNIGIEVGQLLVLLLIIPILHLLFRFVVAEKVGIIILSAIVAHTAWHWMIERGGRLSEFPWPALDAAFWATAIRWLMLILMFAGAIWLVFIMMRRRGIHWKAPSDRANVAHATDERAAEVFWDK